MREESGKSVRESDFLCVKKLQKRPKKRFTHTFGFHAGKKKTLGVRGGDLGVGIGGWGKDVSC